MFPQNGPGPGLSYIHLRCAEQRAIQAGIPFQTPVRSPLRFLAHAWTISWLLRASKLSNLKGVSLNTLLKAVESVFILREAVHIVYAKE